jgi:hypothetical protein
MTGQSTDGSERTVRYAVCVSDTTLDVFSNKESAKDLRRELRTDGKLATTDATVEIEEWSVNADTERSEEAKR